MSKKAKKSFVKPVIGAVAALAVIGAFVPYEKISNVEDTTPSAIVEEIKEPAKSVVEIDQEQASREKQRQHNYVGSSESDKYHDPKCHWTDAINDDNLVHFDTETEALSAGYVPCGTCKP